MLIIGLTGGIGMGKTTASEILKKFGFPVYSADAAVHRLLRKGGKAARPVAKAFPESLKRGAIDRKILGRLVFGQPKKLRQLEKNYSPFVAHGRARIFEKSAPGKKRAAILEIPLLFETGADKRCAITLCVWTPRTVQRARVLARKNMTEEKFKAILTRQMPIAEKRKQADYVIPTGKSRQETELYLRKLFDRLLSKTTAT